MIPLLLNGCKSRPLAIHQTDKILNEDPYLWLEEVEGKKPIQFAKTESQKTLEHFRANPIFNSLEKDIRQITLAPDRVPQVSLMKGELYNFWQDEKHIRGLWRKTSIESYKSTNPKWEVILDLDKLSQKENENWIWRGSSGLPPDYERTLIHLSRGGKDATVIREFNLKTKEFVKGGFEVSEAKNFLSWKDRDTVYVGTDFGPGSMTDSGYPRITKEWKRGTPLSEAKTVHEAKKKDMSGHSYVQFNSEGNYIFHSRQISFYEKEIWYENSLGKKILVSMPQDADFNGVFKNHLLFVLRSDLNQFKQGSLLAMPIEKLAEGKKAQESLQLIMAPTERKFIQYVTHTKDFLFIHTLDNVLSKIVKADLKSSGYWNLVEIPLGNNGMAAVSSAEDDSNVYLAQYVDFLTPSSTFIAHADDKNNKFELLKKSPERFDSKGLQVERFEATSRDGTKIPYFLVSKKDIKLNSKNPTLLYGYGGFELPMQPFYLGIIGKSWIERGGIYVLSNLRGGGEFGPAWHKSVLKENHYKVYEDNIAVAKDLIQRKITSPEYLGISGRSNGGLLTGASFVLRPDLFKAVIVGVPLLDMLRYHKLLAGASWMDEYGNPDDPKMREAILKYSPYQKVSPSAKYPEVFFMTSTKDDRVHPGHARKMVAKMKEQGHSVFYYENMEGGHAGNANLEQSILWNTLEYTYLWEKLGDP
ncbi:MAG: prolyl oligopeptidase family serine peptidase [Pseudobdellovibrionaceae bacterium]